MLLVAEEAIVVGLGYLVVEEEDGSRAGCWHLGCSCRWQMRQLDAEVVADGCGRRLEMAATGRGRRGLEGAAAVAEGSAMVREATEAVVAIKEGTDGRATAMLRPAGEATAMAGMTTSEEGRKRVVATLCNGDRHWLADVASTNGSWKIVAESRGRKKATTTSGWTNDRGGTVTVDGERQQAWLHEALLTVVEKAEGIEEQAPTGGDSVGATKGVEQQGGCVTTGASKGEGRSRWQQLVVTGKLATGTTLVTVTTNKGCRRGSDNGYYASYMCSASQSCE
ncbi:hypothetical protein GW17_00049716 [Ensete ventricosum]|nr:hypothetical protein GW17_00049716 [Ensete ventricosum]